MLARLRASTRLAVLVLLVFALKIGAAAACAKHDFADMGLGSGNSHGAVMAASPADGADADLTEARLGHAATCNHCGCHHAAAFVPHASISLASTANVLAVRNVGLPPSASPLRELRPPIV